MISPYQPEKHSRAALALSDIQADLLNLAPDLAPGLDVQVHGHSLALHLDDRQATFTLDLASLDRNAWTHGALLSSSFGAFTPQYARERMRMLAAVLPMSELTPRDPCWDLLRDVNSAGYAVKMCAQELHSPGDWYVSLIRVTTSGGQTYAGSIDAEDSEDGDATDSVTVGGMNLARTVIRAGIRVGSWPVRADALDALSAHLHQEKLLGRLDSGTLPGQVPAYWSRQFLRPAQRLPF